MACARRIMAATQGVARVELVTTSAMREVVLANFVRSALVAMATIVSWSNLVLEDTIGLF